MTPPDAQTAAEIEGWRDLRTRVAAKTAAADLAAAVVEFGERLPGWTWSVGGLPIEGHARCAETYDSMSFYSRAATPAAALHAVMQQALDARGSGDERHGMAAH